MRIPDQPDQPFRSNLITDSGVNSSMNGFLSAYKDDVESLQKLNWWDWHEDQLRKLHEIFAQEDIGLFLELVSIQHMKM